MNKTFYLAQFNIFFLNFSISQVFYKMSVKQNCWFFFLFLGISIRLNHQLIRVLSETHTIKSCFCVVHLVVHLMQVTQKFPVMR